MRTMTYLGVGPNWESHCVVLRHNCKPLIVNHYNDIIMSEMVSQITSLTIVYSMVYSGLDQTKHQSSASLAFVWGIHRDRWIPPHKGPVTRKIFPFDDVIMNWDRRWQTRHHVTLKTKRRQFVSTSQRDEKWDSPSQEVELKKDIYIYQM